jgi:aryl-alcohol dehydrogenase-like predicted oxidoreductase
MDIRQLGISDLHITPIGFGAWAIGARRPGQILGLSGAVDFRLGPSERAEIESLFARQAA